MSDFCSITGRTYRSRLLVGTGKYEDFAEARVAIGASGAQIMTLAIRRVNIGQDASQPSLLAQAMKLAVEAGRAAFLAGRMPCKLYSADSSSPVSGLIGKK